MYRKRIWVSDQFGGGNWIREANDDRAVRLAAHDLRHRSSSKEQLTSPWDAIARGLQTYHLAEKAKC